MVKPGGAKPYKPKIIGIRLEHETPIARARDIALAKQAVEKYPGKIGVDLTEVDFQNILLGQETLEEPTINLTHHALLNLRREVVPLQEEEQRQKTAKLLINVLSNPAGISHEDQVISNYARIIRGIETLGKNAKANNVSTILIRAELAPLLAKKLGTPHIEYASENPLTRTEEHELMDSYQNLEEAYRALMKKRTLQ